MEEELSTFERILILGVVCTISLLAPVVVGAVLFLSLLCVPVAKAMEP